MEKDGMEKQKNNNFEYILEWGLESNIELIIYIFESY